MKKDIDSDFCINTGYKVFEHLNEKYGREHCCNIITFSNLQARATIKDVARTFEIPLSETELITKLVPKDIHDFDELLDIKEIKAYFAKYPDVYKHCSKIYGAPRHHSQHPAGICVTPMEVMDLMPVENAKETPSGFIGYMSQFEKDQVEMVGAVKLDILKLKTMSILKDQSRMLKDEYGINMHENDIPIDDEKTWDLICSGDTLGIFQMESPVGKDIIKKIQPRNMEELSAVNAFVRPGTSGLEEYCLAKKHPEKIRKIHPKLDVHLASTMGGIVYQEQIMFLISEILGVSFGKADIYRRALEKPNKGGNQKIVQKFNDLAIEKGLENGIPEDACKLVRDLIIDNSAYLFNKSHSIAYSYITCRTAWVKANYPLIFYTTLFNSESAKALQMCIQEAKRRGVKINKPDVSCSKFDSVIENKDKNEIRMGLNCVKGIGEKAVESIIQHQPFSSVEDFFARNNLSSVNKGVIEAVINIGALENIPIEIREDDIGKENVEKFNHEKTIGDKVNIYLNRNQQLMWYEQYLEINTKKTIPNYLIDVKSIKGKYFDNFEEGELIYDDGNFLVVPATQLEEFGLVEENILELKTRKRPKGILKAEKKEQKISNFRKAFKLCVDNLSSLKQDNIKNYLKEIEMFEISFIDHPLESISDKIKEMADVEDGNQTTVAGIVVEIINRQTKKGKDFKNIIIQTPREKVRITMWQNNFEKYQNMLVISNIVMMRGVKGFGGVTSDYVKQITFNHN